MKSDSTIRHASAPDSPDETPSTVPAPKRPPARWALIGVVLVGCGAWAFWPLSSPADGTSPIATDSTPVAPPNPQREQLDMTAFRTPLWVIPAPPPPPPAPPPPAPVAPPPPPLNWQLIAITQEQTNDRPGSGSGTCFVAVIYDPGQDLLITVKAGQTVGTRTIESVDATEIAVRDAGGLRRLPLRPAPDGGARP